MLPIKIKSFWCVGKEDMRERREVEPKPLATLALSLYEVRRPHLIVTKSKDNSSDPNGQKLHCLNPITVVKIRHGTYA